jgi:hypothetical protein
MLLKIGYHKMCSELELDNMLRKPQRAPDIPLEPELVWLVKETWGSLKEKYSEDNFFVRKRPEEEDGKADVKQMGRR